MRIRNTVLLHNFELYTLSRLHRSWPDVPYSWHCLPVERGEGRQAGQDIAEIYQRGAIWAEPWPTEDRPAGTGTGQRFFSDQFLSHRLLSIQI